MCEICLNLLCLLKLVKTLLLTSMDSLLSIHRDFFTDVMDFTWVDLMMCERGKSGFVAKWGSPSGLGV